MSPKVHFALIAAVLVGAGACAQTAQQSQSSFITQTAGSAGADPDAAIARRLASERTLATDVLAAIAYQRVTGRPLDNVAGRTAVERISAAY